MACGGGRGGACEGQACSADMGSLPFMVHKPEEESQ
jgi:hypothetical protein